MDRLHNAIAKARASRESGLLVQRPGKANLPQPSDIGADWSALPELRLSDAVMDRSRIVARHPGPNATAFDLMRTNLLRQLQDRNWTRVAITSPGASSGKTTLTLNLAFSLARLTDIRVMVLEFDLRRPTMTKALGIDGTLAFSAVLEGRDPPEAQLIRVGRNLAFGVSTHPIASPAELLSSDRAADVVDQIEASYRPNVIFFDMPPMLAGDDTLAFLDQVDCALMVVAAEETPLEQIDQCGKDLAGQTQVLGVVLNKCRMVDPQQEYGYG